MRTLNVLSISMPAIRLRWEHHLHPCSALTCIFTVLKKIPSSNVETRQNSLVPNRILPKRKLHQQKVAAFYTARFLEPVMGSQAMQRKMISKSLMDLGAMDCLEKMCAFLAVICLKKHDGRNPAPVRYGEISVYMYTHKASSILTRISFWCRISSIKNPTNCAWWVLKCSMFIPAKDDHSWLILFSNELKAIVNQHL